MDQVASRRGSRTPIVDDVAKTVDETVDDGSEVVGAVGETVTDAAGGSGKATKGLLNAVGSAAEKHHRGSRRS